MNAVKTVELLRKYARCKECSSQALGNGEGSVMVTDNTFKRTCKCGWSIEVNYSDKPFVGRQYFDSLGHVYFVRAGLGENAFKVFKRKPDKSPGYGEHAYRGTPWRETAGEAQIDLDALAIAKKWKEVQDAHK